VIANLLKNAQYLIVRKYLNSKNVLGRTHYGMQHGYYQLNFILIREI
jgi:hypothetical protein